VNRTEFVIATAIILLVAFTVGYFACWLVQRFSRVSTADVAELDQMAKADEPAVPNRSRAARGNGRLA